MITTPKPPQGYFVSAWMAGVALVTLIVGVHGATQPLLPIAEQHAVKFDVGDEVLLEQFNPPAATAEEVKQQEPEQSNIEIPPLPAMQSPLSPPQMMEITPLKDAPPPAPKSLPQKPKTESEPKRAAAPAKASSGGGGAITTFTGGGSGHFSSPPYPTSARGARQQGNVRLLVTVEASGLPSSVTVESSSGYSSLDSAARDHVSRRWHWPAGEVRRYIVPIRFLLQP